MIVAVGVNTDGRREVLGMDIGPSEAETFWTEFLRKLARRGLRGVKLVISDAHEGIKAAVSKVLTATWQRCRVHFMRNALAHAGKSGRRVVSAFIATAFAQDDAEAAKAQWRKVADQLRPKLPKLAGFMDEAEPDVLAYMSFPASHRDQAALHQSDRTRPCCNDAWRLDFKGCRRKTFPIFRVGGPIMPFELHSKGRRHIPRQRHRVANWREYDATLRYRGSLTIWFTPDAIAGWNAHLEQRRAVSVTIRISPSKLP